MVARQVARPITSLLRTRRPFKAFLFALLIILLFFKGLPGVVLDWVGNDPHSNAPASKTPLASPPAAPTRENLKPTPVLGKHRFRVDGLVEVNEDGAHPIYELISRAEREWRDKLQRASKTLEEAVNEYRRRYKRRPPKGFDLW